MCERDVCICVCKRDAVCVWVCLRERKKERVLASNSVLPACKASILPSNLQPLSPEECLATLRSIVILNDYCRMNKNRMVLLKHHSALIRHIWLYICIFCVGFENLPLWDSNSN